jgi:hypothetical protein
MRTDTPPSEIPKIEAAQRQLDEAIRLWMEGRDPVAIHTLTMAAFGILYNLAEYHDLLIDDDPLVQLLSGPGHKRFRKFANFLKHAKTDPTASYPEPPIQEHEQRIGFTLLLYRLLVRDLTPEMGAFHLTMLSTYPELFQVAPDSDPDIEDGAQYAAEIRRKSWEKRRQSAKLHLNLISQGLFPANVNLRRRYHS